MLVTNVPSESSTQFSGCLVLLYFSSSPSIIIQASIDQIRADVTDDWFVANSEDEDALRPVEIADQSGLLPRRPETRFLQARKGYYSVTHSFITSQARNPQRGCQPVDISIPPPGYQDSDSLDASPLLRRGAGTLVHTIIIND